MKFISATAPATLASWTPKMSSEAERRLSIKFEIALTEEVLAGCPKIIQNASKSISKVDAGIIESAISVEYPSLAVEVYELPDHTRPALTLSNTTVRRITVYRPESAEGPTPETFLLFTVHTGPADAEMVWTVMSLWKNTCFLKFHEMQASMAFDGKAAGANDAAA